MFTHNQTALAAVNRAARFADITGKPWAVYASPNGFRVRPAFQALQPPLEVCWP